MNRLARRAITLLVLAMILPTVVAVLGPFLAHAVGAQLPRGDAVNTLIRCVVGLVFVAGLLVRASGAGGPETEEQRRARLTVRRSVEDEGEQVGEPDDEDDPLVPWEEE